MNLNQVTIKSTDVSRAVQFYTVLGLRLIVDSSPRYVRFETPQGESTLSISHSDSSSDKSTVLYFEVNNLNQVYRKLKQQGLSFINKPMDKRWLWREAELTDPDGHPLKLYMAGENRKNPPWRLNKKRWFDFFVRAQLT